VCYRHARGPIRSRPVRYGVPTFDCLRRGPPVLFRRRQCGRPPRRGAVPVGQEAAEGGRLEGGLVERPDRRPRKREVFLPGDGRVVRHGRRLDGEAVVEFVLRRAVAAPPVLDDAEVAAHRGVDPQFLPQLAPQPPLQPLSVLDVAARQKGVGLSLGPDDEEAVVAANNGPGEEVGGRHQECGVDFSNDTAFPTLTRASVVPWFPIVLRIPAGPPGRAAPVPTPPGQTS